MVNAVRGVLSVTLLAGTVAGFVGVALADVKAGVDAWAAADYGSAVREWQGPATSGDPDAQFNLAQAYKLGRGVPRDLAKAESLYAAAAAKGHLQASDNYGLLLFQRGERSRAMPYITAAAGRGDPRAQYILGLALFNGDGMAKDWVRAYAYVSLAQQAGLPQATAALTQMDQYVSMGDRQKSVAVASRIASDSEASRTRQVAAADLDVVADDGAPAPASGRGPTLAIANRANGKVDRAAADATRAASAARDVGTSPRRGGTTPPPSTSRTTPGQTIAARAGLVRATVPATATATARITTRSGPWRLQLGAFGVPGNAEALWTRVRGRPELAGHGKLLIPAGKLTKLQAGGFTSQAEANAACAKLRTGGFTCLATRD